MKKKTDAQETDLVADRLRRILVLLIAFFASWLTAFFVEESLSSSATYDLIMLVKGAIPFGDGKGAVKLPVPIIGLLASGGSSLWNNVLGYTKAVKDIRSQQKANESLTYQQNAKKLGLTTYDTGNAVRQKVADSVIDRLSTLTEPGFSFGNSFANNAPLLSRI
ncbi:hypothetical protein [Spirosoma foliorum]|uniref:Uncharacterized protein n=1 Tax=Spirosoma foliorum TaxID=2710596 RepID=A0A7G5GRK9_9BACT|nr:hypothetical protein [Spirosoma foliorum]QMW01501.1 hypothetical protein H3H32_26595 [Spirosoma foliorum]